MREQVRERKGDPFSVRFGAATDRAIEAEARRVRRSKSAVVEALADEAMRMRQFPGIGFRDDDARRRPWIIGSGLDIWEICEIVDAFGSIEQVLDAYELTDQQIRLALAYKERYPEEIEQAIAENNRTPEEWLELYPFIRTD